MHIGFPKTGTTSLQRFLSLNKSILQEHGVAYPESGRINKNGILTVTHWPLVFKLINGTHQSIVEDIKEESKQYLASVISCEGFILNLHIESFRKNLRMLVEQLGNIEVVLYLRDPVKYLESAYNQSVKHNLYGIIAKGDINEFILKAEEKIGFHPADYNRYLDLIRDVFLNKQLVIRDFSKDGLTNSSLYDDFLSNINELSNAKIEFKKPNQQNESLSKNKLELKRIINCSIKMELSDPPLKALFDSLPNDDAVPMESNKLSIDNYNKILEIYRPMYEKIIGLQ